MSKATLAVRFLLGFAIGFGLSVLLGCTDATGPSEDAAYHPQFQQVYQGGGSGGHGGGASGGGLTRADRAVCTLAGTNNDIECGKLLMRMLTGGLAGTAACLRGNLATCGALYGWGTEAAQDWRSQPDPFYQPWFNPGGPGAWPPGVGGEYPRPIGGF